MLKIYAYNRRADVRTVKRGFVVTSDSSYCSLVLINRGVVLGQNSSMATVEFNVYGPALQMSCILDGGKMFTCEFVCFCREVYYPMALYCCSHPSWIPYH